MKDEWGISRYSAKVNSSSWLVTLVVKEEALAKWFVMTDLCSES